MINIEQSSTLDLDEIKDKRRVKPATQKRAGKQRENQESGLSTIGNLPEHLMSPKDSISKSNLTHIIVSPKSSHGRGKGYPKVKVNRKAARVRPEEQYDSETDSEDEV